LAFAYENLQKPAIPSWFAAPPASKLRETSENLWAWYNMHEHRSLRCSVQEDLAFYEDSIAPGGLAKGEYRRTRAGAGLSADNRKNARLPWDLNGPGRVAFRTGQ